MRDIVQGQQSQITIGRPTEETLVPVTLAQFVVVRQASPLSTAHINSGNVPTMVKHGSSSEIHRDAELSAYQQPDKSSSARPFATLAVGSAMHYGRSGTPQTIGAERCSYQTVMIKDTQLWPIASR